MKRIVVERTLCIAIGGAEHLSVCSLMGRNQIRAVNIIGVW